MSWRVEAKGERKSMVGSGIAVVSGSWEEAGGWIGDGEGGDVA